MQLFVEQRIREDYVYSICCPQEGCQVELAEHEIKRLASSELIEKYHILLRNRYINTHSDRTSWCPTPDCPIIV